MAAHIDMGSMDFIETFQNAHTNNTEKRTETPKYTTTTPENWVFHFTVIVNVALVISIGGFYVAACQFHSILCSDYFVARNRFAACVAIMINFQMYTYTHCMFFGQESFSLLLLLLCCVEWWACANPKFCLFLFEWTKTYTHFMKHCIEMDMNELLERYQRTNTWFFNMKQVFPRTYRFKPINCTHIQFEKTWNAFDATTVVVLFQVSLSLSIVRSSVFHRAVAPIYKFFKQIYI